MRESDRYLNPAEAAARLNISAKALRVYEQRGFVHPARSAAGWRVYSPDQMKRAADVVALRNLGLSLAQIARTLGGEPAAMEPALAAHQSALEGELQVLRGKIDRVRNLRQRLSGGDVPAGEELAEVYGATPGTSVSFELPWPWGGERFELRELKAITYIVGPLGSGKTRLAQRLAEALAGKFIGLDRATGPALSNPEMQRRLDAGLHWITEDGGTISPALVALLSAIEGCTGAAVVDLVEQGIDQATQEALIALLRRKANRTRPLLLLTRSSAILDPAAVTADEAIIYCPANHSPPFIVPPYPGAPGFESLIGCLAPPEARARTEGMIAWRPTVAA